MVYYLLFFLISMLSIFEFDERFKKYKIAFQVILTIFLSLLVALRVDVGNDYDAYVKIFKNIAGGLNVDFLKLEVGYYQLNKSFSYLGLGIHSLFFVTSAFSLGLIFYSANKFRVNTFLVVLIYYSDLFFYYNLSGFRQSIAMPLVLLGFWYIKSGNSLKFVLSVLLASAFHKVAFVFIIAYPAVRYFSDKLYYTISVSLLIIIPVAIKIGIFEIIEQIGFFRNAALYTSDYYNQSSLYNFLIGSIKRIFPLIVVLFLILFNNRDARSILSTVIFKVYTVGIVLYISLYYNYPDISVRLTSYALMTLPFVLCYSLLLSLGQTRNFILVLIILYCFSSLYQYTNLEIYSYKSMGIF